MYLYKFGTPESKEVQQMRDESFVVSGSRSKNIMETELCSYIAWQAKQINATRILELGTFTGSTTLALAQACKQNIQRHAACKSSDESRLNASKKPRFNDGSLNGDTQANSTDMTQEQNLVSAFLPLKQIQTLSSTEPLVLTADISCHFGDFSESHWRSADVIRDPLVAVVAEAEQVLQELLANGHNESFDLIIVDADKSRYSLYYDLCLKLLRRGGLITFDNVLWRGGVPKGYFSTNQEEDGSALLEVASFSADVTKEASITDAHRAFPEDQALYYAAVEHDVRADVNAPLNPLQKRHLREARWMTRNLTSLRQFNAHVASDPNVEMFILPMGDGLMLVTKK